MCLIGVVKKKERERTHLNCDNPKRSGWEAKKEGREWQGTDDTQKRSQAVQSITVKEENNKKNSCVFVAGFGVRKETEKASWQMGSCAIFCLLEILVIFF